MFVGENGLLKNVSWTLKKALQNLSEKNRDAKPNSRHQCLESCKKKEFLRHTIGLQCTGWEPLCVSTLKKLFYTIMEQNCSLLRMDYLKTDKIRVFLLFHRTQVFFE